MERQDVSNTPRRRIAYGHAVNCTGFLRTRSFIRLRPESKILVRGNIYSVPDLRNPFLGMHFTRRHEGEVTVGPSAFPLLGMEQYRSLARPICLMD